MATWIKWNDCSCGQGGETNPCFGRPVITGPFFSFYIYQLSALSYAIQATNSPTSWSASGLPASLSINTSTGEITGTVYAAVGWYTVLVQASNACGAGEAVTIMINVISQPASCNFTPISISIVDGQSTEATYDVNGQFTVSTTLKEYISSTSTNGKFWWRIVGYASEWYAISEKQAFWPTPGIESYYTCYVRSGTTQLKIWTNSDNGAAGTFTLVCL